MLQSVFKSYQTRQGMRHREEVEMSHLRLPFVTKTFVQFFVGYTEQPRGL